MPVSSRSCSTPLNVALPASLANGNTNPMLPAFPKTSSERT